jgi:hypothetical protein
VINPQEFRREPPFPEQASQLIPGVLQTEFAKDTIRVFYIVKYPSTSSQLTLLIAFSASEKSLTLRGCSSSKQVLRLVLSVLQTLFAKYTTKILYIVKYPFIYR